MGSMPADTTGVSPAGTAADSSFTGAALFRQMECATCHTVDPDAPASTGPSLYGLYGSEVTLQNGRTLLADEAYLRESILQAGAKIPAGYMPVMRTSDGQQLEEKAKLTDPQHN